MSREDREKVREKETAKAVIEDVKEAEEDRGRRTKRA